MPATDGASGRLRLREAGRWPETLSQETPYDRGQSQRAAAGHHHRQPAAEPG